MFTNNGKGWVFKFCVLEMLNNNLIACIIDNLLNLRRQEYS